MKGNAHEKEPRRQVLNKNATQLIPSDKKHSNAFLSDSSAEVDGAGGSCRFVPRASCSIQDMSPMQKYQGPHIIFAFPDKRGFRHRSAVFSW